MTFKSGQYEVDGTPVKIVPTGTTFRQVYIHTDGTLYLNATSGVTTTTGYKLDVGEVLNFTIGQYDEMWAVSGSGTHTVYVLWSEF